MDDRSAMDNLEARFQSLRERARRLGLDVTLTVAHRLYEGDEVTLIGGGSISVGKKTGPSDGSISSSLSILDGFIAAIEVQRG